MPSPVGRKETPGAPDPTMLRPGPFTTAFLREGIEHSKTWTLRSRAREKRVAALREALKVTFNKTTGTVNEAQTRQIIIDPALKALGWGHLSEQSMQQSGGRTPDYLLFSDPEAPVRLVDEGADAERLYKKAQTLLEAKRWNSPLGRLEEEEDAKGPSPATQVLSYLDLAAVRSDGRVRWAMLTNGRMWRLYWRDAYSKSDQFLELDLWAALKKDRLGDAKNGEPEDYHPVDPPYDSRLRDPDYVLELFATFFSPDAFSTEYEEGGVSLLSFAVEEAKRREREITSALSEGIVDGAFPALVSALADAAKKQGEKGKQVRVDEKRLEEATRTFLFRLLFLLYAEDRNLLPVNKTDQNPHGQRPLSIRGVRHQVASAMDGNYDRSSHPNCWEDIRRRCRSVDEGDEGLGIPIYNGGLFDENLAPLLNEVGLSDEILYPIVDRLSRYHPPRRKSGKGLSGTDKPQWINFRDLSVRELGAAYEMLLQYKIGFDKDKEEWGREKIASVRKQSGVYYTDESLVQLVLERTLGPLVEERVEAFRKAASEKGAAAESLEALDPAVAILNLKIVDPAMGSGHFLVAATDWLTERILEVTDVHAKFDPEHENEALKGYESPLLRQVRKMRVIVRKNAEKEKWKIPDGQLDDSHLVRRLVLKNCIHGVDKSSVSTELAKLSLWLHSFTVGAPLSYLDHHIQNGDSLYGETVEAVEKHFEKQGGFLSGESIRTSIRKAAEKMGEVEESPDADIAGVHASKKAYERLLEGTRSLWATLSLMHALRWLLPDFWKKATRGNGRRRGRASKEQSALGEFLDTANGDMLEAIEQRLQEANASEKKGVLDVLLRKCIALAREERFFHWQVAFPNIWDLNGKAKGGFDAVVSNPPWDRMKFEKKEWLKDFHPDIAQLPADQREREVAKLKRQGKGGFNEFEKAKERSETSMKVARECGYYPATSCGDVNLYALFVERAQSLVKPDGIVGMVTPPGIASDYTLSPFFREVSTTGRVACLFSFENRKDTFFSAVSEGLNFMVSVIGGPKRTFEETDCAFSMRHVLEISGGTDEKTKKPYKGRAFPMEAADFRRVNPNTGTASFFRTCRDAEIVKGIYRRLPILVRLEEGEDEKPVWPARFATMFHMTKDAGLFHTREALEEEGFVKVEKRHLMKKGREEALPLYEGKMIDQFDHRDASIRPEPGSIQTSRVRNLTSSEQHADPNFQTASKSWVLTKDIKTRGDYFLGFRSIAGTSGMRTMKSAIVPGVAFGNNLPLLIPVDGARGWEPFLLANFNAFVLDYVARCKVQTHNMNLYILEQLPVVPLEKFKERKVGSRTAEEIVREEALALTYTAHDLAPFARDLGYDGPPFPWDERDRVHRRARLDALFFMLYGIEDEETVRYIMSTFTVVKKDDERKHKGRFLTLEAILAYLRLFKANDPGTRPDLGLV